MKRETRVPFAVRVVTEIILFLAIVARTTGVALLMLWAYIRRIFRRKP
jgi:hypothetical protein